MNTPGAANAGEQARESGQEGAMGPGVIRIRLPDYLQGQARSALEEEVCRRLERGELPPVVGRRLAAAGYGARVLVALAEQRAVISAYRAGRELSVVGAAWAVCMADEWDAAADREVAAPSAYGPGLGPAHCRMAAQILRRAVRGRTAAEDPR